MRHVPRTHELVDIGLATEHTVKTGPKSSVKVYRISDEGMRLIREAMRENALEAIASGEAAWVQPPSRHIPGLTKE